MVRNLWAVQWLRLSLPWAQVQSLVGDFPGSPVVKTSSSNAGGTGSIPGRGAKIPHALRPKNQNIKQKQYCNKFNKDFKNGPHWAFLVAQWLRILILKAGDTGSSPGPGRSHMPQSN